MALFLHFIVALYSNRSSRNILWLTGNTKPYKEDIKALEFRYSPKKYAWYKAPKDYKKEADYDQSVRSGCL